MDENVTVEIGDKCIFCPFNYDGLDCRIFPDRYDKEQSETFDPYEERPSWCQWKTATVKFNGNGIK